MQEKDIDSRLLDQQWFWSVSAFSRILCPCAPRLSQGPEGPLGPSLPALPAFLPPCLPAPPSARSRAERCRCAPRPRGRLRSAATA